MSNIGSDGGIEPAVTWAQVIKMRIKPDKEQELVQLLQQIRAGEQPGSGWVRSITGRDQRDHTSIYSVVLFESEEKARARENDPRRDQTMQAALPKMAEISDGPREFINLDILDDASVASSGGSAATQDTTKVFRRLIDEVINGQNLAAIDELFAPDFVEHERPPGYLEGLTGTRQLFTDLHTAFPDLHVEIDDMFAQDDKALARMTWSGTQSGLFMGIPPTGKKVSWAVYDIVRVENGKAAEHWGQMDMMSLLQQLGVIPAPETAAT